MQRRRARDPMDSLELGNQLNLSASIPMRKLTRMKVVKYLILILIAILIHTTYRLLWRVSTMEYVDLRLIYSTSVYTF